MTEFCHILLTLTSVPETIIGVQGRGGGLTDQEHDHPTNHSHQKKNREPQENNILNDLLDSYQEPCPPKKTCLVTSMETIVDMTNK